MRYAAAAVAMTLATQDVRREQRGRTHHRRSRRTWRVALASTVHATRKPHAPFVRALHFR
jgi:hypothetical protein